MRRTRYCMDIQQPAQDYYPVTISVDTRATLRRYERGWITVICCHCEHRREMPVATLAAFVGWDATIEPKRRLMRCSKCQAKGPALTVSYDEKPRGWNALRG